MRFWQCLKAKSNSKPNLQSYVKQVSIGKIDTYSEPENSVDELPHYLLDNIMNENIENNNNNNNNIENNIVNTSETSNNNSQTENIETADINIQTEESVSEIINETIDKTIKNIEHEEENIIKKLGFEPLF